MNHTHACHASVYRAPGHGRRLTCIDFADVGTEDGGSGRLWGLLETTQRAGPVAGPRGCGPRAPLEAAISLGVGHEVPGAHVAAAQRASPDPAASSLHQPGPGSPRTPVLGQECSGCPLGLHAHPPPHALQQWNCGGPMKVGGRPAFECVQDRNPSPPGATDRATPCFTPVTGVHPFALGRPSDVGTPATPRSWTRKPSRRGGVVPPGPRGSARESPGGSWSRAARPRLPLRCLRRGDRSRGNPVLMPAFLPRRRAARASRLLSTYYAPARLTPLLREVKTLDSVLRARK